MRESEDETRERLETLGEIIVTIFDVETLGFVYAVVHLAGVTAEFENNYRIIVFFEL